MKKFFALVAFSAPYFLQHTQLQAFCIFFIVIFTFLPTFALYLHE